MRCGSRRRERTIVRVLRWARHPGGGMPVPARSCERSRQRKAARWPPQSLNGMRGSLGAWSGFVPDRTTAQRRSAPAGPCAATGVAGKMWAAPRRLISLGRRIRALTRMAQSHTPLPHTPLPRMARKHTKVARMARQHATSPVQPQPRCRPTSPPAWTRPVRAADTPSTSKTRILCLGPQRHPSERQRPRGQVGARLRLACTGACRVRAHPCMRTGPRFMRPRPRGRSGPQLSGPQLSAPRQRHRHRGVRQAAQRRRCTRRRHRLTFPWPGAQ